MDCLLQVKDRLNPSPSLEPEVHYLIDLCLSCWTEYDRLKPGLSFESEVYKPRDLCSKGCTCGLVSKLVLIQIFRLNIATISQNSFKSSIYHHTTSHQDACFWQLYLYNVYGQRIHSFRLKLVAADAGTTNSRFALNCLDLFSASVFPRINPLIVALLQRLNNDTSARLLGQGVRLYIEDKIN